MLLKRVTDGGQQLLDAMEIKSYFNAIGFSMCSEPLERTRFLTFERQSKKLDCSILLLLAI